MKILMLSQFFSNTRGGGEYVFNLVAKNLVNNGNKVWVVTNKIEGERYESYDNLEFIFVPPTLTYKGGLPSGFIENLRYSINAIKVGLSIIRKEKIDVIHSNNFAPALAGSILSSLTSVAHITTVHDVFTLCGKNYWKEWGKQNNVSKLSVILGPFFEKLMVKLKHESVHTVSEATRDDLIKLGEKKPIYVIPNSIETNSVINQTTNPFQFIYVGRLVFYKNLELVIKAINIVRKSNPSVKLLILGDGPHRNVLEEMIKKFHIEANVDLRGFVSADEKARLISGSAAMTFPSLCEGFGLVILEAFLHNKAVLVSNIRPMSDIVTHNKTGYVLDPNDEKVWADHLLRLIKNPNESQRLGKNGNDLLVSSFSQDMMYEKIMKMYTDVIKNRK